MSSLRDITDGLKRPLEEKEVWTLLNLSIESLGTSYRDFKPSGRSRIGPCLIISVDGLLIYKNNVQFNAGLQSEAAPDVTAPELLKDDGKQVNNLEELQKTHVYSLGAVLLSVIDSSSVEYSDVLLMLLNKMKTSESPSLRPTLEEILEISQKGMERSTEEDDFSPTEKINDMFEDTESNSGEPNLAAEIAAVEPTPSVGSSLSINSKGTTESLDTLGQSGNGGILVRSASGGLVVRPGSGESGSLSQSGGRWSSQEKLKSNKEHKRKRFYTPDPPRRKGGDLSTLPPLPPSQINRRSIADDTTATPTSFKPLPHELTSTPKSDPAQLESVTKIDHILEKNEPKKDTPTNDDEDSSHHPPHYKLSLDLLPSKDNDLMAPPTPPPSSPPPLNSPIEEEGVVNSSLTTPLTGGDEYGSLEEPKQETLTTSNFKLSSSPSSPPSSLPPDSEDPAPVESDIIPQPPKRVESLANYETTAIEDTLSENTQVSFVPPTPPTRTTSFPVKEKGVTKSNDVIQPADIKVEVLHDENEYAIPLKKILLPLNEGSQTLDRSKQQLIPEDIVKTPSADDIGVSFRLPQVTPPERSSMPVEIEVLESPNSSFRAEPPVPAPPLPVANSSPGVTLRSKQKISQILGQDQPTTSVAAKKRSSHLFYLETHEVTVETYNNERSHARIKPSAACNELLQTVAKMFGVEEQSDTFGLALKNGNEFEFLDPTQKVYKYAPSGWKSWKPGSKKEKPRFTLHFRVMYYPPNIAMINHRTARHYHFQQALDNVMSGAIRLEQGDALKLAGLALQAKFGDSTPRQRSGYFRPNDYVPLYILQGMLGNVVHDELRRAHQQRKKLTRDKAEYYYLKEVAKLEDYGYTYYKIWKSKERTDDSECLVGFSTKGVRVCHIQDDGQHKEDIMCPWKATTNIEFKYRKFVLQVMGSDPVYLYTDNYKRGRYYVRFSQLCHYFDRNHRDGIYRTPEDLRDEPIHNVLDYNGEFISVRLLKDEQGLGITIKQHHAKSQEFAEIKTIKKGGAAEIDGKLQIGDLLIEVNKQTLINKKHREIGVILKDTPPHVELKVFRRTDIEPQEDSLLLNVTVETAGNRELSFDEPDIEMLPLQSVPPREPTIEETSFINDHSPTSSSPTVLIETISINRNKRASFGFSIIRASPDKHITVTKLTPGGAAEESKSLSVNDEIIAINGRSVMGKTVKEVSEILKGNKDDNVQLQVRRPLLSSLNESMSSSSSNKGPLREGSNLTLLTESIALDESGLARSLSEEKIETVKLRKKNGSFGFSIQRSLTNPYGAVSISKVTPGGAAADTGRICVHDQIVSINGQCTDGKGYKEVFDMLRNVGEEMELEVCPPCDGSHVTVMLDKRKGPLGLRIKEGTEGRIVVSSVVEKSQAEESRQVEKGDEIVQVNGNNVHGMSLREATDLLLNCDSPVYIYIKKQKPVVKLETILEASTVPIMESTALDHSIADQLEEEEEEDDEYHKFTLTLTKGAKGFGFKIRKDRDDEREFKGLFIASVDYDPALSDGRLQSDDEIIEVNGESFIGIHHKQGVGKLKAILETGTIVIRRKKKMHLSRLEEQARLEEEARWEEEQSKLEEKQSQLEDHSSLEEQTKLEEQLKKEEEEEQSARGKLEKQPKLEEPLEQSAISKGQPLEIELQSEPIAKEQQEEQEIKPEGDDIKDSTASVEEGGTGVLDHDHKEEERTIEENEKEIDEMKPVQEDEKANQNEDSITIENASNKELKTRLSFIEDTDASPPPLPSSPPPPPPLS